MKTTADMGLIGLAVMGENLILNMESRGFTVACFNRTVSKVDEFINGRASGRNIIGCRSLEELLACLERPRKVMLMVKAGAPVDDLIQQLLPWLDAGDVLIDGGNSHYADSVRRTRDLSAQGILFLGTGVSGGEEGALKGPSIMPGGNPAAWPLVQPIFQAIAARADDGTPCCDWMGPDGAGHFVKMVHNGIEYGDMQLICEAYHMMSRGLGMPAPEIKDVFVEWNKGVLDSYLIEITGDILGKTDPETGRPVVDIILDVAGQKGTGKWTSELALDLGVPVPQIAEAVFARYMSAVKTERVKANEELEGPASTFDGDREGLLRDLHEAVYAAKICSYAQGFQLLRAASAANGWNLNLGQIAQVWRSGCIIRARFLGRIKQAYDRAPALTNLLLDPYFSGVLSTVQGAWRNVMRTAIEIGLPVPALSSALNYYDGYRCDRLPANLLQAQRDYFGAHTYERVDRPRGQFFHTEWISQ